MSYACFYLFFCRKLPRQRRPWSTNHHLNQVTFSGADSCVPKRAGFLINRRYDQLLPAVRLAQHNLGSRLLACIFAVGRVHNFILLAFLPLLHFRRGSITFFVWVLAICHILGGAGRIQRIFFHSSMVCFAVADFVLARVVHAGFNRCRGRLGRIRVTVARGTGT